MMRRAATSIEVPIRAVGGPEREVAMSTLQATGSAKRARGPTAEALSRLLHHRSFLIGGALVLLIVLIAIFADLIAPFDPLRSNVRARLRPPDGTYWFGTDHF